MWSCLCHCRYYCHRVCVPTYVRFYLINAFKWCEILFICQNLLKTNSVLNQSTVFFISLTQMPMLSENSKYTGKNYSSSSFNNIFSDKAVIFFIIHGYRNTWLNDKLVCHYVLLLTFSLDVEIFFALCWRRKKIHTEKVYSLHQLNSSFFFFTF